MVEVTWRCNIRDSQWPMRWYLLTCKYDLFGHMACFSTQRDTQSFGSSWKQCFPEIFSVDNLVIDIISSFPVCMPFISFSCHNHLKTGQLIHNSMATVEITPVPQPRFSCCSCLDFFPKYFLWGLCSLSCMVTAVYAPWHSWSMGDLAEIFLNAWSQNQRSQPAKPLRVFADWLCVAELL